MNEENPYSEFFYSGNPKLNIIHVDDVLTDSVWVSKDRIETDNAKSDDEFLKGKDQKVEKL